MSAKKKSKTEVEEIPAGVVDQVAEIYSEIEKTEEEIQEEIHKLMHKLEQKKLPLLKKRNAVLSKVPNFWLNSFKTFAPDLVTEEDLKAISHLTDFMIEPGPTHDDTKFIFTFGKNPFFNNKQIIKTVKVEDESPSEYVNTPIEWKAGQNFLEKAAKPISNAKMDKKRQAEDEDLEVKGLFRFLVAETTEDQDLYELINALTHIFDLGVKIMLGLEDEDDEGDDDDGEIDLGEESGDE
ncbi:hypothetical protein BJ742DRAFT_853522 [Cladochytrium replicatum]|nr:hypothetical protein BJ742DRAFT_853522 [Cladochytrium replicatum]